MAGLEGIAPNYKRAQQRWPEAPMLPKYYEALDACFAGNGHGMVEHIKSYIECVCLTIMGEMRAPIPSSTPSTTELLVAALNPLGLRNSRGASKIDKVLSGFNKLADALTEMRNDNGPVAHGKDAFLDPLPTDHARAFLHAGDIILGLLLNAYEGKQPDLIVTREPYENFSHLNKRIDRAVSVEARIDEGGDQPVVVFSVATGPRGEVIELRVEPSRLLYGIDREAYVEVLKTADLAASEEEEEEKEKDKKDVPDKLVEMHGVNTGAPPGPVAKVMTAYEGTLRILRPGVAAFLTSESLEPSTKDVAGAILVDSLLGTIDQNMAVDWKQREPIQARLKVACKRVLVHFGVILTKAETTAENLVAWLRVQGPDNVEPDAGVSSQKEEPKP